MMRTNIRIFNYLCRASQELNTIFSVPVFILLTAKFISVVTAAFAFSYNYFIRSSAILNSYSSFFCYLFFADWFKIMVLLAAADMPVNQVLHNNKCKSNYFIIIPFYVKVRLFHERITTKSSLGWSQTLAGKILVRFYL